MTVVLDRTFLMDLQAGETRARALLDDLVRCDVPMVVPAVVLPSILARASAPDIDVERIVEAAEVVPFTLEQARQAAAVMRFRSSPAPLGDPTAPLVEATALDRRRLAVVTRTPRHYDRCRTRSY